ncbi:MAG: HEAT repeat domain-containing protein [candidate division WOR-3 bacterium]|nr:MAG: HEAT repeat domain-containing protein [candidate division WOR-3 bacterium]
MEENVKKLYDDLLKLLRMGVYLSRTYPEGHPSLKLTVERVHKVFEELRIEKRVVSIVVIESVLKIDEERFDSQKLSIVKFLVDRFNQVGVNSITFNTEVSEWELNEFFSVMALQPAEIDDYGDIATLMRTRNITGIKVNIYRVGVVTSDSEFRELDWDNFLESMITAQEPKTEEERLKELGSFLGVLGVTSEDTTEIQTEKILTGLEKLALMVMDRYGEERWNEYSLVFSRILAILSPSVKKNIIRYRSENAKLAEMFRKLVPTMEDDDIVDIVMMIAKKRSPNAENDIVDILKNVTSSKLPDILTTLGTRAPETYTSDFLDRLMKRVKATRGPEAAMKYNIKNLEMEMKSHFPALRSNSTEERIDTIDQLVAFADRLFEAENYDLVCLMANRLDAMAEAEQDLNAFAKAIGGLKILYIKARDRGNTEVMEFIAKKFAKYLMRKDTIFLERKRVVIKAIGETRDPTYMPELLSSLWAAGTYAEAREALIALADTSAPLLVQALREIDNYAVRMKILDTLKRMSDKAIPEILKLLQADEWYARRNGVFILGELKAEATIDNIGALIDEDRPQIQLEVVSSLSKIGGEKSVGYLKKALNSKYPYVTLEAMKCLAPDDFKHKLPQVLQWLKRQKAIPNETDEQFRAAVIEALAKSKEESVINALTSIVRERALLKRAVLLPTKAAALTALAQIATPKAMQALQKSANSRNRFIAATAQDVLQRITTEAKEETES